MNSSLRLVVGLSLLTVVAPAANAQTTKSPAASTPQANSTAVATPPVIEEQALNLLKKNQQAMLALRTYYAECRTILTRDKPRPANPNGQFELATLTAEKPNKMRYDRWELAGSPPASGWTKPAASPDYTFACDGKDNYKQFGKMYRKDDRVTPEYMHTILEPWGGFYAESGSAYASAMASRKQNELRDARITGQESVEGLTCDKVFVHAVSSYNGQKVENTATYSIGPDGLVRHYLNHVSFNDTPGISYDATLTNIRLNEPVDAAIYAYTPPSGVKPEPDEKSTPLLANGTTAPDFTATDINKKPVKLSDLRGKVVVIDFWASWCGPCNAAMPHNQAVMKKLKAEGLPVIMLAVDNAEGRPDFETWVKQKQASLSALTFVFISTKEDVSGKQFNVSGIPTQYVLDKNGVVRASFVGFDKPDNELEKAVRAALGKSGTGKGASTKIAAAPAKK